MPTLPRPSLVPEAHKTNVPPVAQCADVTAVIVTYNPDLPLFERLLDALAPQVGHAVVVDNGSSNAMSSWQVPGRHANVRLLRQSHNLGIAAAQNIGIQPVATRIPGTCCCLTRTANRTVRWWRVFARRRPFFWNLAGSPWRPWAPATSTSVRTTRPRSSRTEGWRIRRQFEGDAESLVDVDYLIASGCLIALAAIDAVGPMRESMFIDYVDIEWGFAPSARLPVIRMLHRPHVSQPG